nr:unnamed protein product [Digitaria exilis]
MPEISSSLPMPRMEAELSVNARVQLKTRPNLGTSNTRRTTDGWARPAGYRASIDSSTMDPLSKTFKEWKGALTSELRGKDSRRRAPAANGKTPVPVGGGVPAAPAKEWPRGRICFASPGRRCALTSPPPRPGADRFVRLATPDHTTYACLPSPELEGGGVLAAGAARGVGGGGELPSASG